MRVARQAWLGSPLLSYPDRLLTVVDVLDLAVADHPTRAGFVDGGEVTSYRMFAELVEGAPATLRGMGLRSGDRVGVAAPNSLALAVLLFACARGGFVMIGLSTRLRPPRWAALLAHSRAALALGGPAQMDGLRAAAQEAGLDRVEELAVLTARRQPWSYTPEQRPDESATYAVVYTSGTTGAPKGSQVAHRPSMHSAYSYQALLGLGPEDRTAVAFPLTYISGLHAHVLPAMLAGAANVLVPETTPAVYLRVLTEQRITWAYTVPSLWLLLLRRSAFAAPRLDSVRLAASGGSPFPHHALRDLQKVLRNAGILDVYGLTETHSPAAVRLPQDPFDKLRSVGRPLPCMEARTVDGQGDLLHGKPGELELRGSLVTSGYLDDPDATAEAIRDGWFRTGDIARIDDDGYVWILDRAKDVIDRGGQQIFPAEIEQILLTHPDVADAAVIGVPAAAGAETVACFLVPRPGRQPRQGELRRWVAERLAAYAAPRLIRLVDDLPRNPTGKVAKDTCAPACDEPLRSERGFHGGTWKPIGTHRVPATKPLRQAKGTGVAGSCTTIDLEALLDIDVDSDAGLDVLREIRPMAERISPVLGQPRHAAAVTSHVRGR